MADLKAQTRRSLKWNAIDKLSTQLIYALVGILLARLIAPEEFGLVGAVLVFQAFAALFVDSGFASALIQRKVPTEQDYSTVFWFNMLMALGFYLVIWICAPLIDLWFHGHGQLIPLARASALTMVLNAAGIVQVNRMVKQMNVRPVAIANALGLLIGGGVGVWLALEHADAWALVWQQVISAGAKSLILWLIVRWKPLMVCSWGILKGFFAVGSGVMVQSLLNVVFQNIYSFFIGNRLGFTPLGNYTQADKWSKMGTATFSGVLTSSFLPALSEVQDQPERFARFTARMHRTTAWVLLPGFAAIILLAPWGFHLLFGSKWDAAIVLFQLLMARGVFVVLSSLYCNFILAKGRSKLLVVNEVIRDVAALGALLATIPCWSRPDGLEIMLYGQIAASAVTFVITLAQAAKVSERAAIKFLMDLILPTAVGLLFIFAGGALRICQ